MGNTEPLQVRKRRARRTTYAPPIDVNALRAAELLTVEQFARLEPAFSPASVRWLLFNSESNGLEASGAVVRVGRRVYLHQAKFRAYLTSQRRTLHPGHSSTPVAVPA